MRKKKRRETGEYEEIGKGGGVRQSIEYVNKAHPLEGFSKEKRRDDTSDGKNRRFVGSRRENDRDNLLARWCWHSNCVNKIVFRLPGIALY